MKKRQKRPSTIRKRILISSVAVLMLQAILFVLSFLQGGIMQSVDNNAFDILNERTINRKNYVENEMISRWSNLKTSESEIVAKVEESLARQGKSAKDINTDAALCESIVAEVAPNIIYTLRRNGVTGSFIVLNGPGSTIGSKAGLYLRDLDPTGFSEQNSDILVERGMPAITKEQNLSLDSFWTSSFEFGAGGEGASFFTEPLAAASLSTNKESANFGYWSSLFSLSPEDVKVITYSVPLFTKDGTAIGVIGIDITEKMLATMLSYEELGQDNTGSYMIGVKEADGKIRKIVSNGPYFSHLFGAAETLNVTPNKYSNIYDLKSKDGEKAFASEQEFKLYNNNTYFENQQWVLLGIRNERALFSLSNSMKQNMALSIGISLLLGIAIMILSGNNIVKPVTGLVNELKSSDPGKPIHLKKINFSEIDNLSDSIEMLSEAVAKSASKISKIIELSGVPIGVYEYIDGAESAFCSKNIFKLFGWKSEGEQSAYIPLDEFLARLDKIKNAEHDGENLVLINDGGENRWIKIIGIYEKGSHLGVVSDVTNEVDEKRKIEYERDYDVLTRIFNRRAFATRLEALLSKGEELGTAALCMWDLDNLKYVNDTYGHDSGDQYIAAFARILCEFDRGRSLVGRRSGDEFYVFLHGFETREQLRSEIARIEKIINNSSFTLTVGGEYRIRASGGVAWYPDDAATGDMLIHYADFAMYSIKRTEKGSICEFDRSSYKLDALLLNGQGALDMLIDRALVAFAMQPVLGVSECAVIGYELLMRPQVEGLSSPTDVLRIAKMQGKLNQIERLTMFKGMDTVVSEKKKGALTGGELIFINSVPNQCLSEKDLELFAEKYHDYLSHVVLEITENEPCDELFTKRKIGLIKGFGGFTAIDDYGSGYNSEALLIFLSPDIVKIDISIIHGIDLDKNRQSVLSYLISYARSRGIKVLAEGVETKEEMEYLVANGADYLQGFYIGKPTFGVSEICPEVVAAVKLACDSTGISSGVQG